MTKTMKLRTALVAAIAAAAVIGTAAWAYLTPAQYISLDINPSIQLTTNRLDDVIDIKAVNPDAEELLQGYRLRDRDLDDVIEDLVDRMVLCGYLSSDKQNDVLITVSDEKASAETLEKVNAAISDYVAKRQVNANVLSQTVKEDKALTEKAQNNQISAGRMAVVEEIFAQNGALSPEKLADMTVTELLDYAESNSVPLELLEERLDDLDDQYRDNRYEILEEAVDDLDDKYDDARKPVNTASTGNKTAAVSSALTVPVRGNDDLDDIVDDLDDRYDDWDDRYDDWDDRYDDDWDDRYDDDWDDRYDDDWDDRYDDD